MILQRLVRRAAGFAVVFTLVLGPGDALAGDLNPPPGPIAPTPGPNPAKVINATNTPGNASATFVIKSPGAYRLDGNLMTETGKVAILITSRDVHVDLGGFTVSGPDGLTTEQGIVVNVPQIGGAGVVVSVNNGTVTGFTNGFNVSLPQNAASHMIMEGVTTTGNTGNGIRVSTAGNLRLRNVQADGNELRGVDAASTSLNFEKVTANDNGLSGIVGGKASVLNDVQANENGGDGISVKDGSDLNRVRTQNNDGVGMDLTAGDTRVRNFLSTGNGSHGINTGANMRISDGQASLNGGDGINGTSGVGSGVTTRSNFQSGVRSTGPMRFRDSSSSGNSSFGYDLGPGSSLQDCQSSSNTNGARLGDRSSATSTAFTNNSNNGLMGNEYVRVTDCDFRSNGNFGATLGQFASVSGSSASFNIIGLSVAGGSTVCNNRVALNADGVQVHGPAVVSDNVVVANGNGVVVFNNGSGTQIRGNTFKSHTGGQGVLLLGNYNTVLSNAFRENATNVLDSGMMNKIAPIQCDPTTAGPYDNWLLNAALR